MKVQRRRFLHVLGATTLAGCGTGNGVLGPEGGTDASGGSGGGSTGRGPGPGGDGSSSGGGSGSESSTSGAGESSSSETGEPDLPDPENPDTEKVFAHGIASGDPAATSVLLWTRVTVDDSATVEVYWSVATDVELRSIVAEGRALAGAERDHCLTVEASGLEPDTTYYYRFEVDRVPSMIGRTKTAPEQPRPLKFAVCSCCSMAHGWFHAYRRIAERDDLDAVIHLGDYIYEYASNDYGEAREYDPPHEILTLDDYRRRYRHYRRDADLQEVHRRHPFITTWDDHESANKSWRDGAQNHTPSYEGPWSDRKAAAMRVYFEYMPVRDYGAEDRVHRYLSYGDVAELIVLDTRLHGRDHQAYGASDDTLWDDDRQLLGDDQESFVAWRLEDSTATWKIVCQQVMMAPRPHQYSISTDAWEGYPRQRDRMFERFAATGNVVVLTGDVHSSWAADLVADPGNPAEYDPESGAGSVAVELVAPACTSEPWRPDEAKEAYPRIAAESPHVKHVELTRNGYMIVEIEDARVRATWMYLDDVADPDADSEEQGPQVEVRDGEPSLRQV